MRHGIASASPKTGGSNLVYGVISSDDNGTVVRMPFNRVDYYLKRPTTNFPSRCFPGSFILYRATINHGNGVRNEQPLIDCVMDFQVAFGVDTNGDQALTPGEQISIWPMSVVVTLPKRSGRGCVKSGFSCWFRKARKTIHFRFSGTLNLGDAQIANNANFQTLSTAPMAGALSTFTPAGDAARYRWKVAQFAIKPMNLE